MRRRATIQSDTQVANCSHPAGRVIGRTEDMLIVAAARAEDTLLELARALGRRAARSGFKREQDAQRPMDAPDALA